MWEARTGCTPTTPVRLCLDLKRKASMIDEPPDQAVAQRSAGGPEAWLHVRRVAQQANCAFGDHLGRRTVTGIAVAFHRSADLAAVGRDRDIEQIVEAALALLFRRPLARLGRVGAGLFGVRRHHSL